MFFDVVQAIFLVSKPFRRAISAQSPDEVASTFTDFTWEL